MRGSVVEKTITVTPAKQATLATSHVTLNWREAMATWLDTTAGSANTRSSYSRAVSRFFEWLGMETVWPVNAVMLAHYRALLIQLLDDDEAPLAPATIALRLTALRSFFTFCATVGVSPLHRDVITQALKSFRHKTVRPYDVLSPDQQVQFLAWVEDNLSGRDGLLIELMLRAGLRVSEVVRLRCDDLRRDEQDDAILHVKRGKGRKDRLVPLVPDLAARLETFADGVDVTVPHALSAHVFSSAQSDGLTTRRVQQIVKAAIADAGLPDKFSCHSLRHTFAITLLRRGASIKAIQALLGHASPTTTERYLDHLEMDDLKKAVGISISC